jgi:Stage II sporulation protein E (SpoIIE)
LLVSEGVEERIGRLVLASCEAFDNYPPGILGRALAQAASLPGELYLAFQPLRARPSFPKSCRDFPNGALRLTTSRRAVGGDIYDFIELPDGQLALVVDDVTDKGIPTALVMATTHSILRSDAQGETSPGEVLERANERLYPDIPPHMFVTSLRGAEPR